MSNTACPASRMPLLRSGPRSDARVAVRSADRHAPDAVERGVHDPERPARNSDTSASARSWVTADDLPRSRVDPRDLGARRARPDASVARRDRDVALLVEGADADRQQFRRVGRRVDLVNPRRVAVPDLAAGERNFRVGNGFLGTVTQIDGEGRASRPFLPQPNSTGRLPLTYGFGSLWIGSQDDTITRLDPRTLRPVAVIRGVSKPQAIANGANGVWVAEATRDDVVHIDPRTNRVISSIPIGGRATGIATTRDAVWVATPSEGRLWRLDPRANSVTASIDVGGQPTSVATSNGTVWVSSPNGALARINRTWSRRQLLSISPSRASPADARVSSSRSRSFQTGSEGSTYVRGVNRRLRTLPTRCFRAPHGVS